jgi:ketosteroid isomerase-like protein
MKPISNQTATARALQGSLLLALVPALLWISVGLSVHAQTPADDEASIRAAIAAEAAAWNRADIPAFMETYENSSETVFIGVHLRKGYGPILERYKASYSTPEQMGTLTFKDLDVRLMPSSCGTVEFAVVTGSFHLERSAKGLAAKDDGVFSLVWRKGLKGWKIILDHTS